MSKHTPGSWEALYSFNYDDWVDIRSDDDGVIVASVQFERDARLIESAPKLLEALIQMVECLELDYGSTAGSKPFIDARAAIRKATGEDFDR